MEMVSIPKHILHTLIDNATKTIDHTNQSKIDEDLGYAYSYGYLESHYHHTIAALQSIAAYKNV